MHLFIPPVPIPPGNSRAFVQVLCPGDGAFVHPGDDPPGTGYIRFPNRKICGERNGFRVTVASPRRTSQVC